MNSLAQLLNRLDEGDIKALARLLSMIEAKGNYGVEIEKHINSGNRKVSSFIIGITGLPGSGKSTIVDRLIDSYLVKGKNVGVIAIDPSSPSHGGALLGDRVRLMRHSTNPNVLIRSMASRGSLGGISSSTYETARLMSYAGYDPVILETVGMGQLGCEVADVSNVLFAVSAPGLGDEIQLMKSGVLDTVDAFVMNKIDLTGAEQALSMLRGELGHRHIPLFETCASRGTGIDDLVAFSESRRSQIEKKEGLEIVGSRLERDTLEQIGEKIRPIALQFIRSFAYPKSPDALAEQFLHEFKYREREETP